MKCGNAIALLCPCPVWREGKGVWEPGGNQSDLREWGNMEHPCPTGETQPLGINPSSQSRNAQLCAPTQVLCFTCSVSKESVCSGGFWIQPLKALKLPSRLLKNSLLSMEHQLRGVICRTGAEKVYMLVSKITSLPTTICITVISRSYQHHRCLVTTLALSFIRTKMCFDFPDVRSTEDNLRPYPRCILVGWVGVCALRCPRPCPCAGTESTLLRLRKPWLRYSGIRLGLSAVYHRVGNCNRAGGREGKRKRRAVQPSPPSQPGRAASLIPLLTFYCREN